MADAPSPEQILDGVKSDLARWRETLSQVPDASGFDQHRSLLYAWIKEGERLLERLR